MHILTFCWLWWSNRNKLREGELPEKAEEVARRTRANVMEYMQIFRAPDKDKCPTKWKPPPDGTIKINADGSFTPGQTDSSWGVVARDSNGEVLLARAGRQAQAGDAFAAEMYALSHAITMAAELGVVRVIFETDSTLLMEAMDLTRADASAYAAMDKGKEVMPLLDKGKEMVPPAMDVPVQDQPNVKRRNYEHYHEEAGPTHFSEVIFAPKPEVVPLPLDFTKHFPAVLTGFSLKTNTGCSWRVTVKVVDDRVTLD
ncbi:Glutamyl-tRNA reductase 1, chloroplastic [Hordeum vulgare]|nr:Glutamyl-tRNA reductase 1, chloroplastic [Hordeum vulgare]